jgi:mono/diheme cytochrome c family protein
MNLSPKLSSRVSKPLSLIAVLLSSFVLVNAFVVGCGGGGSESDSASTEDHGGGAESGGESSMPAGDGAGGAEGNVAAGQALYAEKCALCHGPNGKGDGPGAAALDPKPRNHTDGTYMNAQSNESLLSVIKDGKGQMPAWGATMSDEEMHAVLAYVRTLAVPAYTGPTP